MIKIFVKLKKILENRYVFIGITRFSMLDANL
jgi:hypothetical protein